MGGWCSKRAASIDRAEERIPYPMTPLPATRHHFMDRETLDWLPRTPFTPLDEIQPETDMTTKMVARRRAEQEALQCLQDVPAPEDVPASEDEASARGSQ